MGGGKGGPGQKFCEQKPEAEYFGASRGKEKEGLEIGTQSNVSSWETARGSPPPEIITQREKRNFAARILGG